MGDYLNSCIIGNNVDSIKKMVADGVKVHTIITSPPYYGLRSYLDENHPNKDQEIGLEESPEDFINNLVSVFRECKDLLADDGVLWVNIGDSYYNYRPGIGQKVTKQSIAGDKVTEFDDSPKRGNRLQGYKEKDLMGIPWELAFALRNDGWHLRQDIIWSKNGMPESVRDRCTKSHEYIFMLTKKPHYYFDNEAIKTPSKSQDNSKRDRDTTKLNNVSGRTRMAGLTKNDYSMANKRSVWEVNTVPYKEAHTAVFPPKLIEPMILAATSEKGHCPQCGNRWHRKVERIAGESSECPKTQLSHEARGGTGIPSGTVGKSGSGRIDGYSVTLGWEPSCECGCDPVPDVVFDPFFGSGTTGGVAAAHGRNWIGCELNDEYASLHESRIKDIVSSMIDSDVDESFVQRVNSLFKFGD